MEVSYENEGKILMKKQNLLNKKLLLYLETNY